MSSDEESWECDVCLIDLRSVHGLIRQVQTLRHMRTYACEYVYETVSPHVHAHIELIGLLVAVSIGPSVVCNLL